MSVFSETFNVSSRERNQMVDITSQVRSIVDESGIADGDVIVYCPIRLRG